MTLGLHPEIGLHYRHVIPADWGPFVDARATLNALTQDRCNGRVWHSVITPAEYAQDPYWTSPAVCYVEWSNTNRRIGAPQDRKCLVALYALEAWGAPSEMLESHVQHWQRFQAAAVDYDAVLTYTPRMVEHLQALGLHAALYPLGFDPRTVGLPRWTTPKFTDYVYWGSDVGKRTVLMPRLQELVDGHIHNVSGSFGRGLAGQLDTARAALHLAHSAVQSFPQWRAWQVLATSACLVAELPVGEPPDTWPLVPGRHFVPLAPITLDNVEKTAAQLYQLLATPLVDIARRAHEELASEFSATACVERYLVPASLEMWRRKHS